MSGLIEKIKEMWTPSEEELYDENEETENEYEVQDSNSKKSNYGKVVNINPHSKLKVILSKPDHFGEEIKNIADDLLKMHAVVLNLEVTPKSESRRLVDFLSGIAYAIGGKIKKVSTDTYVVTPSSVSIEGEDILDEIENKDVYFG